MLVLVFCVREACDQRGGLCTDSLLRNCGVALRVVFFFFLQRFCLTFLLCGTYSLKERTRSPVRVLSA